MLHLNKWPTLWKSGFAIKIYSSAYDPIDGQEFSDIGLAVHKYKYWRLTDKEKALLEEFIFAEARKSLINFFGLPLPFDCVIAVPPNRSSGQSLPNTIVHRLSEDSGLNLKDTSSFISKIRNLPSMKSLKSEEQRGEVLRDAYKVNPVTDFKPQGFLLFDDIIDTGATLRFIARSVRDAFPNIPRYAMTLTALKKNYE